MNRRNFLQLAALALAGEGVRRTWPFRVYSLPAQIVAPIEPLDKFLERTMSGIVAEFERQRRLHGLLANDFHMYDTQATFMNIKRTAYPGINPYLPQGYAEKLERVTEWG
jgi:hypothetical protein